MAEHLRKTTFLNPANSTFVAEVYEQYLKNPASVEQSWQDYFANVGDNLSTAHLGQTALGHRSWVQRAMNQN